MASNRANRGYNSARVWTYDTAASQFAFVGFRPAL